MRPIRAAYLRVREGLKESSDGKKQGETIASQSTPRVLLTIMAATAQCILGTKEIPEARKSLRESNGEVESPQRNQKRQISKQSHERLSAPRR